MRHVHAGWMLVFACAIAIGCGKDDGAGKDGKGGDGAKPFDTSYIPADAVAAVVAHPSALLESELLADAPLDEMFENAKEETGIELTNMRQIVMPVVPGGKPEPAVVIIRTNKPVDKETVGGRKFQGDLAKDVEYEGKTFKQSMRKSWDDKGNEAGMKPGKMAMLVADDTTVVVGPVENIKKVIKSADADSALIKRLKNIEMHDVVVVAEVGEARGLLKDASQGLTGAPKGELAQWAADHVDRVELWIDASPKVNLNVTIDTSDEAGGKRLATEVDELRTQAEGLLMLAKGQLASVLPKELAEKTAKLGTDSVAAIQAEDKGKSFVLSFTEPEGTRAVVQELMVEIKKMQEAQEAEFKKWEKEQEKKAAEFEKEFEKAEEPSTEPKEAEAEPAK